MSDENQTNKDKDMSWNNRLSDRIDKLIYDIQTGITQIGDIKTAEILIDIQLKLEKISKNNNEFALSLAETAVIAATDKAKNFQLAETTYVKFKQAIGEDKPLLKAITENNNNSFEFYLGLFLSSVVVAGLIYFIINIISINSVTYLKKVTDYPHGVYALVH
jgi:hypothetical protein